MGQMCDQNRDQMNNWMRDNPDAFGDQVDCSNPHKTILVKIQCTAEQCSWYGSHNLGAKIEQASYQQHKPGDFLAVRPLN